MASPASALDRPLVLLVDDDHAVRLVMARTLVEEGYNVLTAPDGQAAITIIQGLHSPPDLVITDLRMPIMGGEELSAWVARHHPGIPVLFVSGFALVRDARDLPGPVLAKPFLGEDLRARVRERLQSRARKHLPYDPMKRLET
ncbi:MAG: response regulator [Gemmatimonadota bacterium]|nr:response regulator [Gemmatimonadota bacterium]